MLVYGVLTLIVLLAPAMASTAITQEREQQTWDALATTRLSAWEILFGKWVGRQLIPWLIIVLALPYLLACAFFGGMGFAILPAALVFLVVTTGFYSALGLLCSFQARRTAGATATALTVTAFFCVGTVVINQVIEILQPHAGAQGNSSVMWLNPFFVFSALLSWLKPGMQPPIPITRTRLVSADRRLLPARDCCCHRRRPYFMVSRYHQAVRERT